MPSLLKMVTDGDVEIGDAAFDADVLVAGDRTWLAGALDSATGWEILQLLIALNRVGRTIVLVTHNIFQARRLAHRVAFMLEGAIVELADKDQFFENPQDARTAAFVAGDMVY